MWSELIIEPIGQEQIARNGIELMEGLPEDFELRSEDFELRLEDFEDVL